ncbi:FAD-binding protein [Paracoccus sediminilitoris]|uniref:FAD-binding protein n=1 Tax=Paracoccus sediminilitoris TaxID=2202419 RepID=UPI000DB9412B|nr:FAD-binding protein [Paracoccus sediminilitoris]
MRPETEADLAALIRDAGAPLSVIGGGTRLWPGEGQGARVDMTAMTGVTLYEPEALTLVVRAGTPLQTVRDTLAAEGQMLGFEPDDLPGSTIGGVAATNAAGARRVLAGAARDALIGVRFVDGQGQVIRNGGRVMKNVTGYDLVKLMAGSRGQLGVLTELSFRTTPLPQVTNTLQLRDLDAADAIHAFTVALGGPYDVSAARWTPDHGALIRLEGLRASVASRSAELARRLSDFGSLSQIEDHPWHRPAPAAADPAQDVWRIICRPSQAPTLLERLPQPMLLDWGGALIHVAMPRGQTPDLPHFAGHARRIAGQGAAILPPPDPVTDRIQRDLRDRFDPRGIFRGAR